MTAALRVDEGALAQFASREGAANWELMRHRMPGRFATVAVRVPGDLVEVTCDDRDHAAWLSSLLHSWGIPKSALTVRTAPSEEPTR
ncbi:hypothetical protein [Streptomyces sp. NPDC005167]